MKRQPPRRCSRPTGVLTYVIGFALPTGTDPTTLNHDRRRRRHAGVAYSASDSGEPAGRLRRDLPDIFKKSSAFGSVSQNSTSINTGSKVFQGRFDSTDWSGEIGAASRGSGTLVLHLVEHPDPGLIPASGRRKVFTLQPGTGGVEFKTLPSLNAAQQTALATGDCSAALTGCACAQARIDWLRGDGVWKNPRRTAAPAQHISRAT